MTEPTRDERPRTSPAFDGVPFCDGACRQARRCRQLTQYEREAISAYLHPECWPQPVRGTSTPAVLSSSGEDHAEVERQDGGLRHEIAKTIWETSRRDEGTISYAGANIVADALLDLISSRTAYLDAEVERLRAEVKHIQRDRLTWRNRAILAEAALAAERARCPICGCGKIYAHDGEKHEAADRALSGDTEAPEVCAAPGGCIWTVIPGTDRCNYHTAQKVVWGADDDDPDSGGWQPAPIRPDLLDSPAPVAPVAADDETHRERIAWAIERPHLVVDRDTDEREARWQARAVLAVLRATPTPSEAPKEGGE